ncbi:MAG: DMT family transporter [Candidatus Nealsonbacteria bacterium]
MKDGAALLALLASFIWSISASMTKVAVQEANPITFLIWLQLISALILVTLIYFKSDQKFDGIKDKWKYLLPIGLFSALTLLPQITALTLNMVPYIISLKRTSALFSVVLGIIVFKERNIKPKLFGAVIIIIGVFLISVS